jgi:hypothetical protein
MIIPLRARHTVDVFEFFNRITDKYFDGYITSDKKRIFLRKNWDLIEKIIKKQEVYGLFNSELKAILIILKDKGFRPYIKILAEDTEYASQLLKFLLWNFSEIELFCKLKKQNPLIEIYKRHGFLSIGDRGSELLLCKKAIKTIREIQSKDGD